MANLYPDGYGDNLLPLTQVDVRHGSRMHEEFRRRLFAWLESMDGLIGIGGGWRATGAQPDRQGFAPEGKSFHQDQQFRSGVTAYCAVDLVARNPGQDHRAPTWGESSTAPKFGLHTFIKGEPWHLQPIEIRGWQNWVTAGRPDPKAGFPLPVGGSLMGEFVKVSETDTAVLCRFGPFVWWLQSAADIARVADLCVNTIEHPTVLSVEDRSKLQFLGRQPHYHQGSKAGAIRCQASMFGS